MTTCVTVPVMLLQMCNNVKETRQLHTQFVVSGLIKRKINTTRLIESYSACGEINEALSLFEKIRFPDVYAYNMIIRCLMLVNRQHESLLLYNKLLEETLTPDNHTYTYVLKACSQLKALSEGKQLHARIIKDGIKPNTYIHSSMIKMYANSGDTESSECILAQFPNENVSATNSMITSYMNLGEIKFARQLFDKMSTRDSATWSAMITGYTQNGMHENALVVFQEMVACKIPMNESSLVSALSACGRSGALGQGRWIHGYITRTWGEISVKLGTSIVDMYAGCGCIDFAYEVFKNMSSKDVVAYGVIISGFAKHGLACKCFQLFDEMVDNGIQPNGVIFVAILTACSHGGFVELGQSYFNQMTSLYNIRPSVHHYGCMVDLLGRAGRLDEAEEVIATMVEEPNVVIWGALLAACRIHKDFKRGELAFKQIVALEPWSGERYKLASHVFAYTEEEQERVHKLRKQLLDRNLETRRGSSLIEVEGQVHEFVASDIDHGMYQDIYGLFEG
ncbi:pentatricopeptide repeat-containing protein At5g66520 [Lactuca sativa]|uniref:Pentacotripeptide-repeat region of PRORP domain-containing protein n=1 Tax=Lactuca sativa TaxID=4236 RepID=A0A9R1V2E7_LACSA|nr:pentatricopeptide repeat-containing protein At5g66520 [Lactuca sativa]KAJ0197070.1 hypothetical protein LSAT_V11C700387250 [Lactuca sativa]